MRNLSGCRYANAFIQEIQMNTSLEFPQLSWHRFTRLPNLAYVNGSYNGDAALDIESWEIDVKPY